MRAFEDAQAGAGLLPCVDLAGEVDGAQRVINAASAVQALRVAQYAAREQEQDGSGAWVEVDHGLGHLGEFASDCFGPMLAMGPVAADRKVGIAAVLASKLPLTLAAMSAGDLDWWRATIIATELGEAGRESCAAVEALIHPAVLSEAPGAVTKRVRRVLARVDADALRVKAAKERLDRFVHALPLPRAGPDDLGGVAAGGGLSGVLGCDRRPRPPDARGRPDPAPWSSAGPTRWWT